MEMPCPGCGGQGFKMVTKMTSDGKGGTIPNVTSEQCTSGCGGTGKIKLPDGQGPS